MQKILGNLEKPVLKLIQEGSCALWYAREPVDCEAPYSRAGPLLQKSSGFIEVSFNFKNNQNRMRVR